MFLIIEKIHWFNPLVYIALKLIKQDLEFITDNSVLSGNIKLKEYCRTIVKVASINSLSSYKVPSICSSKEEIERRITQMKEFKKYKKASIACLVIVISCMTLITVSLATDRYEDNGTENEDVNIIQKVENIEDEAKLPEDIEISNKDEVKFICPVEYEKISSNCYKRIHPITKEEIVHTGLDFVADEGEKVKAAASGTVILAKFDIKNGNSIEIKHEDGSVSAYYHGAELLVKEGDAVNAGDEIMTVGKTGMATGAHLHFEIRNASGECININDLFNK